MGYQNHTAWQWEFVPNLDEGDIAMHALRNTPAHLWPKRLRLQESLEARIMEMQKVERVFSQIGTRRCSERMQ